MKQQKYIVEMSEQEYNKCKQIINEFGYVERSPEVKKLYDKKRKIEDEIYNKCGKKTHGSLAREMNCYPCELMYCCMVSMEAFPTEAQKYPRVHSKFLCQ